MPIYKDLLKKLVQLKNTKDDLGIFNDQEDNESDLERMESED